VSGERIVVITDHPWPSVDIEREVLGRVDARVVDADGAGTGELLRLTRDADGILTCFAEVSASIIGGAPRLRVIGRTGIGVDNIDVPAASARSIAVTNVPVYCTDEVAEHVIALMMTLRRRVVDYDRALRAGDWSLETGVPLHRLWGQTFGIFGYGRIGAATARRAQALGLRVIAHAPSLRAAEADAAGVEAVTLDELAQRADVLSVHAPLTASTQGAIGAAFLAMMKPGAVLINTARGAIVDQDALVAALHGGRIGGAALDVFDPERLERAHPLLSAPNTLLTPHVAYYSEESLGDLARLAAENVAAVLDGRRPASVVNGPALGRNGTRREA
jgi:D-3-phosphoglycerate dehydrogenase